MVETSLQATIKIYEMNDGYFRKALDGMSDASLFMRWAEESNPMIWIAGHLLLARCDLLNALGVSGSMPWKELFVRGSKVREPAAYPAVGGIVQMWAARSDELARTLASLDAGWLARPSVEGYPSSDRTVRGNVEVFLFHECYHIGQMGFLYKRITARSLLED